MGLVYVLPSLVHSINSPCFLISLVSHEVTELERVVDVSQRGREGDNIIIIIFEVLYSLYSCLFVCVCVCVCARARLYRISICIF